VHCYLPVNQAPLVIHTHSNHMHIHTRTNMIHIYDTLSHDTHDTHTHITHSHTHTHTHTHTRHLLKPAAQVVTSSGSSSN
jgi:hypothetical protein